MPNAYVPTPTRKPRAGGIFSVDGIVLDGDNRLLTATDVVYVGDPCNIVINEVGYCYGDGTPAADAEKDISADGFPQGIGKTFAGAYGVSCFLGPDMDFRARAQRGYEQFESRFVEGKILAIISTSPPTAVGTGTAAAGIGALEEKADAEYPGLPILWVSRTVAAALFAAQVIHKDGDMLVTGNGTPVIATSAMTDTSIYITGWVNLYRGALSIHDPIDWTHNTGTALVERGYAVTLDCDYFERWTVG
jgi:hypothetical protein